MKLSFSKKQTKLLLTAGALFVFFISFVPEATAQNSQDMRQLLNRVRQMENQLQTISRAVYRGDEEAKDSLRRTSPSSDKNAGASAVAAFEGRLSQLEGQQRLLTGQIEKLNHEVRLVKDSLERMQKDVEQRFQEKITQQVPVQTPAEILKPVNVKPQTAILETNTTKQKSPSEGHKGPPEDLYNKSFKAVREARYQDAEEGFKWFLRDYTTHPLAANAQYWLGETYYVRGQFKNAAKSFAKGYHSFPKSAKASDSLLKLGLSLSRLGKKDDACISFQQLKSEFTHGVRSIQQRAQQERKKLGCL